MFKFALLLFCCALINAKTLVRRDPRQGIFVEEEIQHEKLPSSFRALFQQEQNDVEEIEGNSKVGADQQVRAEQDGTNDAAEEDESESSEANDEEEKNQEIDEDVKKNDNDDNGKQTEDEEDEEDEEDDDDSHDNNDDADEKENKEHLEKDEDDETQDDDDDDDEVVNDVNVQKTDEEEKKEEESGSESEEESEKFDEFAKLQAYHENFSKSQSSGVLVGSQNKLSESFKFPKTQFKFVPESFQNPTNDQPPKTISNLFDLETLAKNFLPTKKSSKNSLDQIDVDKENLDEGSIKQKIEELESQSKADDELIQMNDPVPNISFDLDNQFVGKFISQAIPQNFGNLQTKLQGLKDMWMNKVNPLFNPPVRKDSKVGFGGWNRQQKAMFGNLTPYVTKAVEKAQAQLEENGRKIIANNPPLIINLIPGTPVIFKLKYVEGAHTIEAHGQSKAIRYNKLYAFTQYKFTELRYYYDVIIKPMNLFAVHKSITVILNDAPTRMSLSIENDQTMKLLGLEFVNPDVTVDSESNRLADYGLNYLVNDVHPLIKQKLVEVVSRDSKMLLAEYLKDAQ